jgi:FkbM family methyltransferase
MTPSDTVSSRSFWLKCRALALALAHRLGVSPLMLGLRREVRAQGGSLCFGWRSARWRCDGWTVRFPVGDPYLVARAIRDREETFRRVIPEWKGGGRAVDFMRPTLYVMPSGRAIRLPSMIEAADTFGGYVARGAPGPGDRVLDAGAFCGESVVEFALLVGSRGHVFALEPDEANRALLSANLKMHGLDNVTILPVALWSHSTTLVFEASGDCCSSVRGMGQKSFRRVRSVMVEALSPADLFERIGGAPDFIKMDIEGAEVEVIEALAPLLAAAAKPVRLAIASYHLRGGRATHQSITPVLRAAGYEVETGNPEHVTTWAWRGRAAGAVAII